MAGADEVLRHAVVESRERIGKEVAADQVRLDFRTLKGAPVDVFAGVVDAEIAALLPSSDGIRLERLERAAQALRAALDAGLAWKGTLASAILDLDRFGWLTIRREGPRQRGRSPHDGN
jgi:hypothetical protein